ncbi:MAG: PAS domain S-box protein, partial [Acidobacteriia bacterium]|nr:PAS domain S-box protein [Terriglobia bacterium]
MTNPPNPEASRLQDLDRRRKDSLSRLRRILLPASPSDLVVFLLACLVVGGFTSYHIARNYRSEVASWEARQTSLAEDRAWAISIYLHERQADAEVLAALPSVQDLVSRAAEGGRKGPRLQPEAQRGLNALIDRFTSVYGYSAIYILGPDGEIYFQATGSAELSRPCLALAQATVRNKRTSIDLLGESPSTAVLTFAVPVYTGGRDAESGRGPLKPAEGQAWRPAGVVLMQRSATAGLFPLLTAPAGPTASGDTVLARRVGRDVEFLSPLRDRDAKSPFLRLPLDQPSLAASAAVSGFQTAGEFRDYRGQRVIAATRMIPAMGWGLIRKTDRAEALTGFYQNTRLEVLAALLLVVVVGGLFQVYRRGQQARALEARVEQQQHILKVQKYAQEIVDSAPAGLLVLSSDLRVLSTNRTFLQLFGVQSQDVVGRRLDEVIHAESPPYRVSGIAESELAPQSVLLDIELPGSQEKRPVRITLTSVAHAEGDARMLVVVEDQSEGERLRAAAEASERRLRDLVQSVDAIVWEANAATLQFTFVSRRAERLLGFPSEEWLTLPQFWEQHLHPADRQRTLAACRQGTAAGRDYELEYRMIAADGRVVWLRDKVRVVLDENGSPRQLCGVMVDATEEKRAEVELRRVNRALKTLSQCNHAMARAIRESELLDEICRIIIEAGEYRFVWVGFGEEDAAKSIRPVARAGYEDGYLSRVTITWSDSETGRGPTGTALRTGQVCLVRDVRTDPKFTIWREEATRRGYASLISLPLLLEGKHSGALTIYSGEPNAFDAEEERLLTELAANVSYGLESLRARLDRERAEEERARLSQAVEQAAEAIVVTDPEGNIAYVNPAFERVTGYSRPEVVGRNPRILKSGKQDAEFYRTMWETLARGEAWSGRFVNRRKDGTLYEAEAVISPVRDGAGRLVNYVAVQRDVTRERQLEEQIRQTQRVEAVGRLAGGVAHDFNNLLTIISGYSDLLVDRLGSEHPQRSYVDEIRKAADRAASLTRQLLAFSRRQVLAPQVLDLNAVVANLHNMLHRLIGEHIELVTVPGAPLGRVKVDPGQIEQVILNLVVNARDAMAQGGKITIETGNANLDADYAGGHFRVKPGSYVQLSVRDTGCGMGPEV